MKLPRPIHRGLPRRIVPRSGDGGSSTRPFAKNLDRTSSHPHTSWPSPSRATSPQPTEPAQVGRVYPNHPAALRPGMRMGSNSPEQLNLHTTRDQVERMQVRLAARAERPGGFGTCVPGTRKRPHVRRQIRHYHNGTGGHKPPPTTPVLARPQPQRTKGPRYPTHSTACETQPQDNATTRPPRQHQGHVTCGPGSWARPHPGGQPAGTAKLARRSSHVAVNSPHATTECTRTPGSQETRIRGLPAIRGINQDPRS